MHIATESILFGSMLYALHPSCLAIDLSVNLKFIKGRASEYLELRHPRYPTTRLPDIPLVQLMN